MTAVQIKLQRHDREPGGDRVYGTKIDKLVGAAVGGVEKGDRTQHTPAAPVSGTKSRLVLHEDGLVIQVVIDLPPKLERTLRRTVRVTVGSHTYEGQLAPEDLKRVATVA